MFKAFSRFGATLGVLILGVTHSFAGYSFEGTWGILGTPTNGNPPFVCKLVLEEGSSGWTLPEPVMCASNADTIVQSLTLNSADGSNPPIEFVGQITVSINGFISVLEIEGLMNQNGNMFMAMSTNYSNYSLPYYTFQFVLE